MMQNMFFFILMLSSLYFFFMKHPLSMGFMLMIQTIIIALYIGMINKSFWFSYSLFLIFLGGMLILFMYMTSIASNEQFNFKINYFFSFSIILILSILFIYMIFFNQKLLFFNKINSFETINLILLSKNLMLENNLMLNKMYNFPMNMITILLINYLFLTLIVTVKITNIFEGPLRPKS